MKTLTRLLPLLAAGALLNLGSVSQASSGVKTSVNVILTEDARPKEKIFWENTSEMKYFTRYIGNIELTGFIHGGMVYFDFSDVSKSNENYVFVAKIGANRNDLTIESVYRGSVAYIKENGKSGIRISAGEKIQRIPEKYEKNIIKQWSEYGNKPIN